MSVATNGGRPSDAEIREEWERLARHEAAHAVIARVLGHDVERVWLHDGGGMADTGGGGFGDDLWARAATIAAAGGASDHAQGYEGWGSDGDLAGIRDALSRMREPFDPYAKADELVAEHEREIDFIAAALHNAGQLSGAQVDQLMELAREVA
jgi:hypothetical protein